ncbi:AAA family ATPase [Rothia sp. LK2588]|uniref:AAA family ATPase n=1 Tax=Rothia sp. LK2588 TaxID=3114369 RepID=UPI0034CE716E
MRIHRLRLSAYGPFPGTVEIDFDNLNEAGIFLLNGPTGSGKSSILDAICFALYGDTSQKRPDLKSHFAPPSAKPEVELECTIGDERYHIIRSPQWDRPKKRGTGYLTENAKVLLRRREGDEWVPVSANQREAGAHITGRIGLNREQFTQVILLPQGDFASFLKAGSSEREQLLKKLFPVETYEQVQARLLEESRAAGQGVQEIQRGLERIAEDGAAIFARVGSHAADGFLVHHENLLGIDTAPMTQEGASASVMDETTEADSEESEQTGEEGERAPSGCEDTALTLEGYLSHLGQQLQRLTPVRATLDERLQTTQAQATEARHLSQNWAEFERLQEELERYHQAEESVRAVESTVALAQASAALNPYEQALTRAQREDEAAYHLCETALADTRDAQQAEAIDAALERTSLLDQLATLVNTTTEEIPSQLMHDLGQWSETVDSHRLELRELAAEQRRLEAERRQLVHLEEQQRRFTDETEALQQRLTQLREEYRQLDDQRIAPQDLPSIEAAETVQQRSRTDLAAAENLQSLRDERERLAATAEQREKARQQASNDAEQLLQRRYTQAAQVLATELKTGEPCPVCGGTEHPQPAAFTDQETPVEAHHVAEAQRQRAAAEDAAQHAQQELTAHAGRIRAAEESGVQTVAQATAALEAAEHRLAQAREAHRAATRLEERIQSLHDSIETQNQKLVELQREEAAAERSRADTAQRVHTAEEQLAEHRTEHPFTLRQEACAQLGERLKVLLDALRQRQGTRDRSSAADAEYERHLANSPFDTRETAHSTRLEPARIEELQNTIRQHRDGLTGVRSRLQAPAMLDIHERKEGGQTPPAPEDLERLAEAHRRVGAARDELISLTTSLTQAHESLTQLITQYHRQAAESEEQRARYQMVKNLADAANGTGGNNALSMPLTTYVLAAQLQDVAAAATGHLQAMTHDRYQLRYTDAKSGHGKSGLGIAVYDNWHDTERKPSTLSGGETFMASLALALGLADVVQARHGGIEIDTLFVDEGFGTLDDSALEEVMATLDDLREHGRVIGLISHVAEMKNRIHAQIQLTTSPEGSAIVADA